MLGKSQQSKHSGDAEQHKILSSSLSEFVTTKKVTATETCRATHGPKELKKFQYRLYSLTPTYFIRSGLCVVNTPAEK